MYDPTHSKLIQRQFRHSGVRLDDIVVINVLYLMCEQQASLCFHIVDPLVPASLAKREKTCEAIKERLHRERDLQVVLMPLVLRSHWSLLVFIPSFRGYIHFDSIDGYHRSYVNELLLLLDDTKRYRVLPLHTNAHSQQDGDWECGFFLLMNAFVFIHMKSEVIQSEETLRLYLERHTRYVCEKNVRLFARKIYDMVSSET